MDLRALDGPPTGRRRHAGPCQRPRTARYILSDRLHGRASRQPPGARPERIVASCAARCRGRLGARLPGLGPSMRGEIAAISPGLVRAGIMGLAGLLGLALPLAVAGRPVEAAVWCHEMRRGESLASVARRAGTSVERLRRQNAFNRGEPVRAGDIIALPALTSLRDGRLRLVASPLPASPGNLARENAAANHQRLSRMRTREHLERFVRMRLLLPLAMDTLGRPRGRRGAVAPGGAPVDPALRSPAGPCLARLVRWRPAPCHGSDPNGGRAESPPSRERQRRARGRSSTLVAPDRCLRGPLEGGSFRGRAPLAPAGTGEVSAAAVS